MKPHYRCGCDRTHPTPDAAWDCDTCSPVFSETKRICFEEADGEILWLLRKGEPTFNPMTGQIEGTWIVDLD